MQEKNENLLRIMAEEKACVKKDSNLSNIDLLIEKLKIEITKKSEDDLLKNKKLTIQSTTKKFDVANGSDHDINKEITELENLIKRLQAEIVVMTETANKPVYGHTTFEKKENNDKKTTEKVEPLIINEGKGPNDIKTKKEGNPDAGFPVVLKDDRNLADQVYAELTNLNALDDVRRNFSVLWDDAKLPCEINFEIPENPIQIINSKPKAFNYYATQPIVETCKPMFLDNILIKSSESTSNITEIACTDKVAEVLEIAHLNNEDLFKENFDVTKSPDNESTRDSIDNISSSTNDNISGKVNKDIGGKAKHASSIPVAIHTKVPNTPGINKTMGVNENKNETQSSSILKNSPNDSTKSLPKPETVGAPKITTNKTPETVTDVHNAIIPEPNPLTTLAPYIDNLEMTPPLSLSREKKPEGILKNINRTLRKIVGKESEKSIPSQELTTPDKQFAKETGPVISSSMSETRVNTKITDHNSPKFVPKNINYIPDGSQAANELTNSSEIVNQPNENTEQEFAGLEDINKLNNPPSTRLPKNAINIFEYAASAVTDSAEQDTEDADIDYEDESERAEHIKMSSPNPYIGSPNTNINQNPFYSPFGSGFGFEDTVTENVMKLEIEQEENVLSVQRALQKHVNIGDDDDEEDADENADEDAEKDEDDVYDTYDVD